MSTDPGGQVSTEPGGQVPTYKTPRNTLAELDDAGSGAAETLPGKAARNSLKVQRYHW